MFDTNSSLRSLVDYFGKENNCLVYVNESTVDSSCIVQIRKNGVWSSTKIISFEEFNQDSLIEALNTLYEELIKGDQNDTDRKTDQMG